MGHMALKLGLGMGAFLISELGVIGMCLNGYKYG